MVFVLSLQNTFETVSKNIRSALFKNRIMVIYSLNPKLTNETVAMKIKLFIILNVCVDHFRQHYGQCHIGHGMAEEPAVSYVVSVK